MRVLLITPPLVHSNTPYPATTYLAGFLRGRSSGVQVAQTDASLEFVLRLFSKTGLRRVKRANRRSTQNVEFFLRNFERYEGTIEPVIEFLQGGDLSLATRIASRKFLPEGSRFSQAFGKDKHGKYLNWAFGANGILDQAKYLASLYLHDLAEAIREGADPRFEFSRYGEKLAASQRSFDLLERQLEREFTVLDEILIELARELVERKRPGFVGFTVPFPGNVYGALRMAKAIKSLDPHIPIAMGGGYVNTELRSLTDPRIFNYIDYITLDDGERPLECLLEHVNGKRSQEDLLRTYVLAGDKVKYISSSRERDIPAEDTGVPTYDGLPLDRYVSMIDMLNPMHRLWFEFKWLKLTLAHGCYWKKCTFCDLSLDYIDRHDPDNAENIIRKMETLMGETGLRGFHFVDEAAPPALLRRLSEQILKKRLQVSWWGNIRFEKSFTPDLVELMAEAGCIAVTGGLEVASERVLKLINKGVTIDQVARVTHAFSQAGILVHAYLMYGYPTQTEQETIDSLEVTRQLFAKNCIQSGFWHWFVATAHSPIGREPQKYGIRMPPPREEPEHGTFARYELAFEDPTPCDHEMLGEGLKDAIYHYMQGVGLDKDVRFWFKKKVPPTTLPSDLISRAIEMLPSL
jgi:radical SAM superfamily enzyme YgiQ (UPF0313 family)